MDTIEVWSTKSPRSTERPSNMRNTRVPNAAPKRSCSGRNRTRTGSRRKDRRHRTTLGSPVGGPLAPPRTGFSHRDSGTSETSHTSETVRKDASSDEARGPNRPVPDPMAIRERTSHRCQLTVPNVSCPGRRARGLSDRAVEGRSEATVYVSCPTDEGLSLSGYNSTGAGREIEPLDDHSRTHDAGFGNQKGVPRPRVVVRPRAGRMSRKC